MKPNDLMIGDWVCHKDYPTIPLQVSGVSSKLYLKHSLLWREDDSNYKRIERNSEADYDVFKPIKLTPEILEKNGFVKQEDCCFRYFKSYDENYYIGFESIYYLFERKTAKITKEHSQSGLQEKVEFTCEYLHELQHALKLCGIEKTIEP